MRNIFPIHSFSNRKMLELRIDWKVLCWTFTLVYDEIFLMIDDMGLIK